MRELHLFAGVGGGILGGMLLGHRTVCAVEIEPYRREILLQRQRDGILPWFPIWDDIKSFDARPWRGLVDVVCGGFPCQDISLAGDGAGLEGERSGLWREFYRVVCEVGPRIVLVENSPALVIRGLGRILSDLAKVGYDARWHVFRGSDAGACHERARLFILASNNLQNRIERHHPPQKLIVKGPWRACSSQDLLNVLENPLRGNRIPQPILRRMDDGLAGGLDRSNIVDRLEAIGDGQIPVVVASAWRTLT